MLKLNIKRFLVSLCQLIWNIPARRAYLEASSSFLARLISLIHLTYGGPARAKELITTKLINNIAGVRNVYYINGQAVLILRYNKVNHPVDSERTIARFLPQPMSV